MQIIAFIGYLLAWLIERGIDFVLARAAMPKVENETDAVVSSMFAPQASAGMSSETLQSLDFNIRIEDIQKHKATDGCKGCEMPKCIITEWNLPTLGSCVGG